MELKKHPPRGASIKVKGRVYRACVQRVLVYGSETWQMKTADMQRLERTEWMMVRCMCCASLKSRISSNDLNKRLNVEAVTDVVRQRRLRWFGHLEHTDGNDWVSSCRSFEAVGAKCQGGSRKTWGECVRGDMKSLGLKTELAQDRAKWAQDRAKWRGLIKGNRPTRASMEKRTIRRR